MKTVNAKQEIQRTGKAVADRIRYVNKQITKYGEGNLSVIHSVKGDYLVANFGGRENRTRKKLTEGTKDYYKYLHKEMLKDELEILKHNYGVLAKTWSRLIDYSAAERAARLSEKYGVSIDSVLNSSSAEVSNEWATAPFQQSDYRLEEKKHVTRHGLRVRSKSEVLIAEKLYDYGIPFRYEAVLNISGVMFSPDFTVRRDDGKIFYWEHLGLTGDPDYMNHQQRKLRAYAGCGIVPWDNLIISYDDRAGNINLKVIDHEIQGKLLL